MAELPHFYLPAIPAEGESMSLPEDTARHIGQVLRMLNGEEILLTDGAGTLAKAKLTDVSKKMVIVSIGRRRGHHKPLFGLQLAIGFTKNASRNEWLLEKAAELGVSRIIPLICERGVKERIRPDRWQTILVSAMLQSQQCFLPLLEAPMKLEELLEERVAQRLIAHCMSSDPDRLPITEALKSGLETQLLIGPEGDFSASELTLAKATGAVPVSLGTNRLRTETAALSAISYFYLRNHVA
jgi:16S rRNA (uracil1498-N3)-methyltransferase